MKAKTVGALVVIVAVGAGMFGLGYYVRGKSCNPGTIVLDPVGPSHTDPKPKPPDKPPTWDWRYCGESIGFYFNPITLNGNLYLDVTGFDDCKKTTQRYKVKTSCQEKRNEITARLLFGVAYAPEVRTIEGLVGGGLGYIRKFGAFGVGGELAYSHGLTYNTQLYQGSLIFKYEF